MVFLFKLCVSTLQAYIRSYFSSLEINTTVKVFQEKGSIC